MTRRASALSLAGALLACADAPSSDRAAPPDRLADTSALAADSVAATTPFTPRDSILFAFQVSEHEYVSFEPIFAVTDGRITSPTIEQGTPEGDAFEGRFYARGTRYHARSGGAAVGMIELAGPALAGCVGLPGDASFLDKVPAAPLRGLAFTDPPPPAGFLVQPTALEDSSARAAALDLLRQANVPESKLTEVEWRPVQTVLLPDGTRIVAASGRASAFEEAEMPAAAFVLFEMTSSGERVILDSATADGRDLVRSQTDFFDAADLDGDGVPEIVLYHLYYESWDYTILRRTGPGWEQVYKGGGGGC